MRVRRTPEALGHISGIQFYIEVQSADAAVRIACRIWAETERLGHFPNLGHSGVVSGTQEWVIPNLPYVIVYEVNQVRREVIILGVFHGAKNR